MLDNNEILEKIMGMSMEQGRKHMRWILSQNIQIQREVEREKKKIFFSLKSHHDIDSTLLSIAAQFIAAKKIRKEYTDNTGGPRINDVNTVPDTIKKRIKMENKKTHKPVMRFLLERIDIIRELVDHGYSYRMMENFLSKYYPRKKHRISHTSIRQFVINYLKGKEDVYVR